MKSALGVAAGFFVVATLLGVVLRLMFVVPLPAVNFAFALHAHSHTLYFGWAALALFALAFQRLGADDFKVKLLLGSIAAVALAGFVTFLHGGYSPASIAVSSLSLGCWAYGVTLFFVRARGRVGADLSFLRVGMAYVAVAGAFALARVGLLVSDADPLYGRLAVFGFLNAFAAFFVFATLGLVIRRAIDQGVCVRRRTLRACLAVMAPLSAWTFPLGVAGAGGLTISTLASVAALVLVVPQLVISRELLRGDGAMKTLALALGLKAFMELGGALGLAEMATRLRHPAILYLHVVLLGFVSAALVLLLRARFGHKPGVGFALHQGGLAAMCVGLLLATRSGAVQAAGLWIAAAAGAVIVAGALVWARPLFRLEVQHRREHADASAHAVF